MSERGCVRRPAVSRPWSAGLSSSSASVGTARRFEILNQTLWTRPSIASEADALQGPNVQATMQTHVSAPSAPRSVVHHAFTRSLALTPRVLGTVKAMSKGVRDSKNAPNSLALQAA